MENSAGDLITNDSSIITQSSGSAFGGTAAAQVVDGVATFGGVVVHHTDQGRLWATASGPLDARSNIFTTT